MLDIVLDNDWDIAVTENGDITYASSIKQAILVHLKWIAKEWRFAPQMGFPWFEEMFVKNPSTALISSAIRNTILEVVGVRDAEVTSFQYDPAARRISFRYFATTEEGNTGEEVELNV